MIFHQISKHHIRYDVMNYDEYHIQYDFMMFVRLSYPLRVFRLADPKRCCPGSYRTAPPCSGAETQYVAVFSAAYDAICCVSPLPRDLVPSGRYCRFAYFPAVVHFRKVVICQKVGSAGNGSPVIYCSGYMSAYYHHENDDGRGKSSW